MTRTRFKTYADVETYFLTSTIVDWIPLFSKPELAWIVLDCLNFLHNQQRMRIHVYVLMEEHLHLICSSKDLSSEIRKFKSYTAKRIVECIYAHNWHKFLNALKAAKKPYKTDQQYQVWQEGFHPIFIRDVQMFQDTMEYIHMNPVKRGYVDYPEHWRYSSSRDYKGEQGLVALELVTPY
jgi:REP element-mobilizing transposase RayT